MLKFYEEMKRKIKEIHNEKVFMSTNSIETDTKTLNAYSSYLSAKSNEQLLDTIRNYNRMMIGFGALNLVLAFINLYLFFKNLN